MILRLCIIDSLRMETPIAVDPHVETSYIRLGYRTHWRSESNTNNWNHADLQHLCRSDLCDLVLEHIKIEHAEHTDCPGYRGGPYKGSLNGVHRPGENYLTRMQRIVNTDWRTSLKATDPRAWRNCFDMLVSLKAPHPQVLECCLCRASLHFCGGELHEVPWGL